VVMQAWRKLGNGFAFWGFKGWMDGSSATDSVRLTVKLHTNPHHNPL
jgi:hypothetical protein